MATFDSSCADRKKMEDEITAYGMSLMNPPSSIDELFKILQVKIIFLFEWDKITKEKKNENCCPTIMILDWKMKVIIFFCLSESWVITENG